MSVFRRSNKCKWNKDKEGSSLISVIIGVVFLAAIGLIVLTVSTRYVVSVYVDRNSTDNFYQAEAILEEVKSGIIQYANESADDAYQFVLDHYLDKSSDSKKNQFAKVYLALLTNRLKKDTIRYSEKETINVVEQVMKDALNDETLSLETAETRFFDEFEEKANFQLNTDISCGSSESNKDRIRKLSTHPEFVTSTETGGYAYVIRKDDDGEYSLTLKNLMIDYKEDSGYQSTIQTDIVITVPDYHFKGDSTLNEVKNYLSISDDIFTINASTISRDIQGNIYTGTNEDEQGIVIMKNATNVSMDASKIISRGSLDIYPGTTVNLGTGLCDLWLKNIRLRTDGESKLGTVFNLNANSYIANDLDIAMDNASVELSGKYYGYSYNEENNSSEEANKAEYSSAILVNGKNTSLLAGTNLQKLILAGRAFVSRNNSSGVKVDNLDDIMMGESVAVKSNQLAYLVPSDYIKTYVNNVEVTDRHNPVSTKFEETKIDVVDLIDDYAGYLKIPGKLQSVDVEKLRGIDNTDISELTNESDKQIKELLETLKDPQSEVDDKPYTMNYLGDYAYVYMNFKNTSSANKYFSNYYKDSEEYEDDGDTYTNKSKIEDNAQVYISDTAGAGFKISPSLYLIAGNIIDSYGKTDSQLKEANYYDRNTVNETLLLDGKTKGSEYVGLQTTLLSGGNTTGSMRLDESEGNLVSGKILNTDEISAVKAAKGTDIIDVDSSYTVGTSGAQIQLIPSGTSSAKVKIKKGLVIAGENVDVQVDVENFTGLILSAGKVTAVDKTASMQSDPTLIGQILEYIRSDSQLSKLFTGMSETQSESPDKLAQCVTYDNWMKNES